MTEALLNDGRQTAVPGAKASSRVSAALAQLTGTANLPRTVAPDAGWLRRAIRRARSVARRDTETTYVGGLHQLRKGMVERAHLPRGGRVTCCAGSVWITADGGGEDVVLASDEFRCFRPGAWLLIEAIVSSQVLIEA